MSVRPFFTDRFHLPNLPKVVQGALWLVLLFNVPLFIVRIQGFLVPVLPLARLTFDPVAQALAAHADFPYQVLVDTNHLLPAAARVLLVTDGHDVRHFEYTTFHRALYYLSPRAVYWMSPALKDGTWESRWWQTAPLTRESIQSIAHAHQVTHVLLLANANLNAPVVARWNEGTLFSLTPLPLTPVAQSPSEFADHNWWWQSVLALLAIFSIGALIIGNFAFPAFRTTRIETLALMWVCGAAIVAFGMVGLNLSGLSLRAQVISISLLGLCGAVWMYWCAGLRSEPNPSSSPTAWRKRVWFTLHSQVKIIDLVLLLWLAAQFVYVAVIAVGQPLVYWDSWVTWGVKARMIFLAQDMRPTLFADPAYAITHLDYPLLLPSLEAWMYQWLGVPDDRFAGLIALFFYVALLGLVYGAARRLQLDRTCALLITAVIGSLPSLTLLSGQVYADIPFASYAVLTTCAMLEWTERRSRGALWLALIGAAALPWLKREGIVFIFAVAASTLLLVRFQRRALWGVMTCLTIAVAVAGGWAFLLHAHGIENIDFLPLTLPTLIANMNRLPTIVFYFAKTFINLDGSFIWLVILAVLLWRLIARALVPSDILLLAPLLYLSVMASGYLFSDITPLTSHLASSGYRLVGQVTPLAVLWLGLQTIPRKPDSNQLRGTNAPL